ncbi:MAG TPA: hypothetical protein VJL80_13115 [Aeromicrobium sp.]|jgi:hypothetical protein|nr:hypothetical protein [Aeromicrobium sp.]HKY58974.1 hypothetical protein [Aeromicrobium sp.]
MHGKTMSQERQERAEGALATLGSHRSDHEVLLVECRQGHRVAAVYETSVGAVFVSRIGPHAHGDMDLPDTGHRVERPGEEFVDTLEAQFADDGLPAWCDCGNRTLSRSSLADDIAANRRTVLVN